MKMLTGAVPPPKPVELALRFRDLSAVTDAVQNGQLAGVSGVNADAVVVIGHSWGPRQRSSRPAWFPSPQP